MKKLLYIGGSHSDIPLITAAKQLGFYVITTGNNKDDLGHQYSDEYHPCDYSDKDEVLKLAQRHKVDYLSPCCNDFSMLSCSYVAEKLGIPSFDTYDVTTTIHHKDAFRMFCQKYNFPSPKAIHFDDYDSAISSIDKFHFPIIVKPIDLTGGKGVSRINTVLEAPNLIKKAFDMSKQKKIVIEEFIEGTNHGLSTFLVNRKVAFYFFDDEHYFINKYLVSGASCPGRVPQSVIQSLISVYEQMANILNLKDGIFHTQFILKDDKPYITEICRRPPGDLYVKFVEYATGISYSKYIIKAYSNQSIKDLHHYPPKGYYTRHCIMTNQNGQIKDIFISKDIESNIFDALYLMKKGDVITNYLVQKAGILFLQYESLEEMNHKVPLLNELIRIEFEK